MWISKKIYDRDLKDLKWYLDRADRRYWELKNKHDLLLSHLGLHEVTINKTELRGKGSPERSDI